MKKTDLLGVLALLTGGLLAVDDGTVAVAAGVLAVAAAYAVARSEVRPNRRELSAGLADSAPRGR